MVRPGLPPEFRVNYEEDLSEHVSETAFLYSNSARTSPPVPEKLERIAGCGSSPVVRYGGTGAYFLDRVAPGCWVVQVYPDAVWVNDPFGPDSFEREVSRVYWRSWPMRISLPDLGSDFTAAFHDTGMTARANQGEITVRPGVWILSRPGVKAGLPPNYEFEYVAPAERPELKPVVWHDPPPAWVSGRDLPIHLTAAAPGTPEMRLEYRVQPDLSWQNLPLRSNKAYAYSGIIPGRDLHRGELVYRVRLASKDSAFWFPEGAGPDQGGPCYSTLVFDASAPIRLISGGERFTCEGQPGHRESVVQGQDGPAWRVSVPGLGAPPS